VCACDIGYTCPRCAAEPEWTPQDERDWLDAVCGVSTPWHDLDSEAVAVAAALGEEQG
jgi:hypothetical protein